MLAQLSLFARSSQSVRPFKNKLSSRTQYGLSSRTQCGDLLAMGLLPPRHKCGHLGFCHYERSEVIQKQMLLAMGLLLSFHSIAMTRTASKFWGVMARGLVPRGHLGFCHYERSEVIQKQMLLAMGSLLSFHSIAMTRFARKLAGKCRTSEQIAAPCILHVSRVTRFSGKKCVQVAGNDKVLRQETRTSRGLIPL